MSVWDELVGQGPVVDSLREVIDNPSAMTHAWLFTGPPGSGRSNAAKAFAAALQCDSGGCGTCQACSMVAEGSHPDVSVVRTDGLSIGVDTARDYVRRAALAPALRRWQVLIVEDADRLTDQAANALLKSIEEPAPSSVWILCATAVDDVMVTVRSRCRPVLMRTPPVDAIAGLLATRDGIDPVAARAAAAAAQGHIGRAKMLASDPGARERRRAILALPLTVISLGSCLAAAQAIADEATARAAEVADGKDQAELANLKESWGVDTPSSRKPAGFAGELSSLTKDQDRRRKRLTRDAIDGVLIDLLAFCRDVVAEQVAPGGELVNADVADDVQSAAQTWT
ncbi:MAG TPA: DNA polymerase III subunit delta', partial [Aeromicrobium sp.]|nr:DNA polymerase III subunit delta' [Aeromicrobium sp.]